jgi:hypothetical protein
MEAGRARIDMALWDITGKLGERRSIGCREARRATAFGFIPRTALSERFGCLTPTPSAWACTPLA